MNPIRSALLAWTCALLAAGGSARAEEPPSNLAREGRVVASSTWSGYRASGAVDGERLSCHNSKSWCGANRQSPWMWEIEFEEPRRVAKVFLVLGLRPTVQKHAPVDYAQVQCRRP